MLRSEGRWLLSGVRKRGFQKEVAPPSGVPPCRAGAVFLQAPLLSYSRGPASVLLGQSLFCSSFFLSVLMSADSLKPCIFTSQEETPD